MDCSTPGFPVLHYLLEFAQTHLHWVNHAIQPSHPLSIPSPYALSLCHHQVSLMSWLFTSGGQSIGASVLPMNIQDSFPLGFTGLISLQSKGLSRVFSSTTIQKHQFFWISAFFLVQLSYLYMTTRKTIVLTIWTSVGKVISQLFNMLTRFVITFHPRSNHLWMSWLEGDIH